MAPPIPAPLPSNETGAIPYSQGFDIQHVVGGDKRGIIILSRPILLTRIDSAVSVSIGRNAELPYMERVNNDTFRLCYLRDQPLGLDIEITPSNLKTNPLENGESRRTVQAAIKLALTAIGGRTEMKGVDLPIGKPIVTRRSVETTVEMQEGEPTILELPVASGKHVFMVMFMSLLSE